MSTVAPARARRHARSQARTLVSDLNRADLAARRVRAALNITASRNLFRLIATALAHGRALESGDTRGLTADIEHARAVLRAIEQARSLAAAIALSVDESHLARKRVRLSALVNLLKSVDLALSSARTPADEIAWICSREAVAPLQRPAEAYGRSTALKLLDLAAQVLPPAERPRFQEEFKSELAEIARGGGGYREQVTYSARQVRSALLLRAALRFPVRRSRAW